MKASAGGRSRSPLVNVLFGALIGLVVIAVCGLGVLLSAQGWVVDFGQKKQLEKTQFSRLNPGDCLVFAARPEQNPAAEGASEVAHLKVDCAAEGFKFRVAAEGKEDLKCPSQWYWLYYSPKLFSDGVRRALCLAPVFEEDACYAKDKLSVWQQVDCRAEYFLRVQKIVEQPLDCPRPDGAIELPLPEPKTVVCAVSGQK